MISPAALEKIWQIGFHPVEPDRMNWIPNQTDFVKVKKIRVGYWQPIAQTGQHNPRPVADNNTRAAMLKTGEAQFAFHSLRAGHTAGETKYRVDGQSVNYAALYQYERRKSRSITRRSVRR